ncbi:MAG: hypothetical protein AB7I01_18855 [Gammaproteobacteria bacterium]
MQKELFKLRNAALAAGLALALGAPLAFADDVVDPAADSPAVSEEALPGDETVSIEILPGDEVVDETVVADEPPADPGVPGDEVVLDDPAVGGEGIEVIDEPLVLEDPVPVDGGEGVEVIDEPLVLEDPVPVDDGAVMEVTSVGEEPVPVRGPGDDDCGMICWNTAIDPALLRGNEAPDDKVFDKDIEVDTAGLDGGVAAELSGAIGAAEQVGATGLTDDGVAGDAPVDVATAGGVSIRNGHLR